MRTKSRLECLHCGNLDVQQSYVHSIGFAVAQVSRWSFRFLPMTHISQHMSLATVSASCINYDVVAGYMQFLNGKKLPCFECKVFFLFISVHIRISVAKHTMLCTQHIDWNYYDAVFSFPSLLPSVQHTSRWPSPWSSDSLSDERSIAFSLVHICFFRIFKKVFIRAARVCIR